MYYQARHHFGYLKLSPAETLGISIDTSLRVIHPTQGVRERLLTHWLLPWQVNHCPRATVQSWEQWHPSAEALPWVLVIMGLSVDNFLKVTKFTKNHSNFIIMMCWEFSVTLVINYCPRGHPLTCFPAHCLGGINPPTFMAYFTGKHSRFHWPEKERNAGADCWKPGERELMGKEERLWSKYQRHLLQLTCPRETIYAHSCPFVVLGVLPIVVRISPHYRLSWPPLSGAVLHSSPLSAHVICIEPIHLWIRPGFYSFLTTG